LSALLNDNIYRIQSLISVYQRYDIISRLSNDLEIAGMFWHAAGVGRGFISAQTAALTELRKQGAYFWDEGLLFIVADNMAGEFFLPANRHLPSLPCQKPFSAYVVPVHHPFHGKLRGGGDKNAVVKVFMEAAFEQQRRFVKQAGRILLFSGPAKIIFENERMDDGIELAEFIRIGKNDLRQGPAYELAVLVENPVSRQVFHLINHRRELVKLQRFAVGIIDPAPQGFEDPANSAFSRTDITGNADLYHYF